MAGTSHNKIPVLLLKTRSTPNDAYEELFTVLDDGRFEPIFVPVLEHRFDQTVLDNLRKQILNRFFVTRNGADKATYGAMIFTSQRAVEAFAQVVTELQRDEKYQLNELLPETLPLYVVGPATARGLRALGLQCPILGEETGNGEVLAAYILEHYNDIHAGVSNPPILFLVGDKRRDVIPKTLQSEKLEAGRRSKVNEVVVYETGEMQSFKDEFSQIWRKNSAQGIREQWIVVFSPTGCKAMLESLGLLNVTTGKTDINTDSRNVFIATIGPTTHDYMKKEFGFVADACAEKPSPEGVATSIKSFIGTNKNI